MSNKARLNGWFRWDDAKGVRGARRPGVYLLAHFDTPPSTIDRKDERIIYVGETCDQTLRKRWARFERSAFRNKGGHSGGRTYFELFGGKGRERLFVAFATPDDDETVLPFRIRYLERKWLLDFVLTHGRPPRCNRK